MAHDAGRGDSCLDMIGVRGAVKIFDVARNAIGRRIGEVAADVAQIARNIDVRPCEWEHSLAVIECRGRPGNCCVARGASCRNACLRMMRVRGAIVILDVARGAVGRRAVELAANVACGAIQSGMRADETKPSQLEVVEFRTSPAIGKVAGIARCRKAQRRVARIVRLLKICQMARRASGRQALKLAHSGGFVARFTFDHGVGADQRETVRVIPHGLDRNLPSAHCVALGTVGTHLTAVNIGVAVCAVLTDVSKDRPEVALRAVDFFVLAAKGISRRVVVEFRNGANRGPACICVTVLAGNGQGAMRTPARLPLRGQRVGTGKHQSREDEPKTELDRVRYDSP